jgi:copper chaperone CopZ
MKKFILILILSMIFFSSPSYAAGTSATVNVSGLVCDFCARAIEKVLGKQDSIEAVTVDLDAKTIVLNFKDKQNIDDLKITELVTNAGYKVVSIIREKGTK